MLRFHLATCLAVIFCLGFNGSSTFAQEPKTVLSDDFLTMPGDDLPALKEYVARLFDYKPRTKAEFEKWQLVWKTVYLARLDAVEKLLKTATDPDDIA